MQPSGRSKQNTSDAPYPQADVQFHLMIAQLTGNTVYVHLIQFLTDLIVRSLSLSRELFDEGFAAANTLRHLAVYDAIVRRDAQAARSALTAHFEFVEEIWAATRGR